MADNISDRDRKRRGNNGSRNPMSKLIENDIARIRDMLKIGASNTAIGKWFNVSHQSVCDIKKGRAWNNC